MKSHRYPMDHPGCSLAAAAAGRTACSAGCTDLAGIVLVVDTEVVEAVEVVGRGKTRHVVEGRRSRLAADHILEHSWEPVGRRSLAAGRTAAVHIRPVAAIVRSDRGLDGAVVADSRRSFVAVGSRLGCMGPTFFRC